MIATEIVLHKYHEEPALCVAWYDKPVDQWISVPGDVRVFPIKRWSLASLIGCGDALTLQQVHELFNCVNNVENFVKTLSGWDALPDGYYRYTWPGWKPKAKPSLITNLDDIVGDLLK